MKFSRLGPVRLLLASGVAPLAAAAVAAGLVLSVAATAAPREDDLRATGERKQKSSEAAARQADEKKVEQPSPPPLAPGEWAAFVEPEEQIFPSLLVASATLREDDSTDDSDTAAKNGGKTRPARASASPSPSSPGGGDDNQKATPDDRHDDDKDHPPAPMILGDANSLVGVRLRLPADTRVPAHVRVELRENVLMETSVWEGDLTELDREYVLQPAVGYKFDALLAVRQAHPLNVSLRVSLDGRDLGQRGVTTWVHSLNDCLYAYQNPDDPDDFQDLAWMFAAYVNEDHPAVRALLREAREDDAVDGFDGYQSGEPGQVLRQVFALWNALQRRGIHYADIGATSSARESTWNMHVRFLDESLDDRQANCVDASVLLASVLRKIGLHAYLVLAPGHMFLGFDLDPDGKRRAYLETTLLGERDEELGKFAYDRTLERAAPRAVRRLPGWKSFHAALDSAGHDYRRNRKRYERDDDPEYQVIDVDAARRQGVLPIAHEGDQPRGKESSGGP